jgi:hypothetical protein
MHPAPYQAPWHLAPYQALWHLAPYQALWHHAPGTHHMFRSIQTLLICV